MSRRVMGDHSGQHSRVQILWALYYMLPLLITILFNKIRLGRNLPVTGGQTWKVDVGNQPTGLGGVLLWAIRIDETQRILRAQEKQPRE